MPLPEHWASPQDFATLFQYLWHKDFPMDQVATGAHRADWTIHIGLVVRQIADLMGLVARFEHGKKTDAILRSRDGDEIAVEWEWNGVWGGNNELDKLNQFKARPTGSKKLKYAVLITYTHTPNVERVCSRVTSKWEQAKIPLLFILIDLEESTKYSSHKEFKSVQAFVCNNGTIERLRGAPAFPWEINSTRWFGQRFDQP